MTRKKQIVTKVFLKPLYVSLCLLLIPFLAKVLMKDFDWTLFDFIVMGGLIYGAIFTLLLVTRLIQKQPYRLAMIFAILLVFILLYIDLAVGIFDFPWSGT